ncbi:MAG: hypothetical protein L6R36_005544 [Xanthoria steineri]|nr:MAG: hypothetical protein L6R36_005544 [Xanthoria steineri]
MYLINLVALLASGLSITTIAAPSASSPIITTNFDNLPQIDSVTGVLVPSPVGVQDGLLFAGFRVRSDGVSIARSVSPPNQAASNNLNRQLQGNPNPSITAIYTGSKVKSFIAISTFVSCVVTAEVQVGVPQSCDLEFQGTKTDGTTVTKTCSYTGSATAPRPPQLCEFEASSTDLTTLVLRFQSSFTTTTTTAAAIDNFKHINNS